MAKQLRKVAGLKAKTVPARKGAAKTAAAKSAAAKRSSAKTRPVLKTKQQKLKLKVHRPKQSLAKAAAKTKAKPAPKRAPIKPQVKALTKAINKKEQRLATLKAVGKKALEKVQAAAQQADKARGKS